MCYSRAPRKPRTELPPFLICHCGLRLRTAFLRRPPFYREGPAGPTRTLLALPESSGLPVARARHTHHPKPSLTFGFGEDRDIRP